DRLCAYARCVSAMYKGAGECCRAEDRRLLTFGHCIWPPWFQLHAKLVCQLCERGVLVSVKPGGPQIEGDPVECRKVGPDATAQPVSRLEKHHVVDPLCAEPASASQPGHAG